MHYRGIARGLAIILVAGNASLASAQALASTSTPSTLTLSVEGRATRTPDIAEVSGGVVTSAPTAAAAMAENASRMSAVVAAVRKAGVAERDIQTTGLNLSAQYRYENNKPPMLTGYQATNTVNLRVRKIAETGRLLDTLVSVGANQIGGPNFTVEDSDAARDEARLAAVKTAQARADLYAKATGLKIRRMLTLSESTGFEPRPQPMARKAMMMEADAAPTPVAPGEVALTVALTIVYEFDQPGF